MDHLTPEQRSANMRRIRSKDTKPELAVRRLAHAMGYRFRLHRRDLPGSPDLTFPGRRKVIFVHGCFWHGHDCRRAHVSKTRREFWARKVERNRARDAANLSLLRALNWDTLVIWECETKDYEVLQRNIIKFLDGSTR